MRWVKVFLNLSLAIALQLSMRWLSLEVAMLSTASAGRTRPSACRQTILLKVCNKAKYFRREADVILFAEGAAIPLAALTAACGLYARLGLPQPWMPAPTAQKIPLVIWGASSAVGSYAIQLAKRSNIHPLICIAGRAQAHTERLIDRSKGDVVIDYRQGHDVVGRAIKASLKGAKLKHALDAVSEMGSYQTICEILDKDVGKITLIVPAQSYSDIPKTIEKSVIKVADINSELQDFGYICSRYFSKGLEEGWFMAQPQEVVPGGLEGIQTGLQNLKGGVASAVKYVYRVADTPGVDTERQ